jgi:hypothetical protein
VDDTPVVLGYFDIATAMEEFEIFDQVRGFAWVS